MINGLWCAGGRKEINSVRGCLSKGFGPGCLGGLDEKIVRSVKPEEVSMHCCISDREVGGVLEIIPSGRTWDESLRHPS